MKTQKASLEIVLSTKTIEISSKLPKNHKNKFRIGVTPV